MKKLLVIIISVFFIFGATIAPVYAGGGKNQGDVGQGTVDQGDTGNEDASPGSDAMGNQVD